MSRRIAFLVAVGALALTAGAAFGKTPPGPQPEPGLEPSDPIPAATLCQQFPHPLLTCSGVSVTCPSSPRAQFACTVNGSAGPVDASVRRLELQLPRRYPKLTMLCQAKSATEIACRVMSRTITRATGIHVVVLKLPNRTGAVHIACATTTKFACKIVK